MDRIAMLNQILTANPNDAFARYGLAMEFAKSGEVEPALEEFGKLLAAHPDYTAGYFMAAQTLAKVERTEEAKKMLNHGIVRPSVAAIGCAVRDGSAARRTGPAGTFATAGFRRPPPAYRRAHPARAMRSIPHST